MARRRFGEARSAPPAGLHRRMHQPALGGSGRLGLEIDLWNEVIGRRTSDSDECTELPQRRDQAQEQDQS